MDDVTTEEPQSRGHRLGAWQHERQERIRGEQRDAAIKLLSVYDPPEYGEAILDELRIDDRYQRARSDAKVNAIRANFQPNACQPVSVSHRGDGSRYLVDGQHRAAVLQSLGLKSWPALIYRKLSRADEARMWAELNTRHTKPSTARRFRAALEFREPEALAINEVVKGAGMRVNCGRSKGKKTGHDIEAVEAIIRIYHQWKAHGLASTLALVKGAWPDDAETNRTDRVVLLGAAEFLTARWADRIDMKIAADVLGKYPPKVWISKTRGMSEPPGQILAKAIRAAYNRAAPRTKKL